MAPKCTICIHPKRAYINKMLMNPKRTLREIAARYGSTTGTLQRHKKHLTRDIQVARTNGAIDQGKTAYEQYQELMTEAKKMYEKATQMTQVAWFREWRSLFELAVKTGVAEALKEAKLAEQQDQFNDMSPAIKELIDAEWPEYEIVDDDEATEEIPI